MAVPDFNILTPNAMLGYGYRLEHFWYGMNKYKPAAIIVDSGSTDGGPYKLGLNKMTCGRESYIRDLTPMLQAVYFRKVKLLIGSVGGDGSTKHVKEMLDIVLEIALEHGFDFKIATIDAGISRNLIKSRIKESQVSPCGPVEPLTIEAVDLAVDVVAQMGAEPYLEALKSDPDIVLGGRSYDPAPYAAFCLSKGVSTGVAWHMGKIMECGGICAIPKGRSMIATMREDSFDLTPLSPLERCTPLSVASHTLYEKTRPDRLPGPGGILTLDDAQYVQLTEKTVRVSGAVFEESSTYQIKLEGVQHLGYRTIFIGGIRDPILINQIDNFLAEIREYTQGLFPSLDKSEDCRLIYHIYGKDGVMGPLEPTPTPGHEIGILGEVVAPTQDLSYTIANNARASILHWPYKGQLATTGNFASPLSPHEQAAGPVFKFSLYHLVNLVPGEQVSLFPVSFHNIGTKTPLSEPIFLSNEVFSTIEKTTLTALVHKVVPQQCARMQDISKIVRSKNSGPFEMTFDIMFDDTETYERVKSAELLTNATIKKLYRVKDSDIIANMYFKPALAWKCTIKRPYAQGSVGELDTLGTQQHAPLLNIVVPAAKSHSASGIAGQAVPNETNSNHAAQAKSLSAIPDRSQFRPFDSVSHIWSGLDLPKSALESLNLTGSGLGLPSSFKIAHIAQSSIALSALTAALVHSVRNSFEVPRVTVPLQHAVTEFKSERLYVLDGKPAPSPWGPIGGLHKTSDGYVRVHDSFPNHQQGALALLGCEQNATREDLAVAATKWASIDLEREAFSSKLVISALRSYAQWDVLPAARAIPNFPISVRQIHPGPPGLPKRLRSGNDRALRGLRVLELSRVIAAPLAGKTLAAHGADVLWVTAPHLPDLPTMDRDFARGKRTTQLDLRSESDRSTLRELAKETDVFIQGYRPGSVAARGFGPSEVAALGQGVVYANMSAYGTEGPWSGNRGFDSLVQTCSGMNVSEAEHYGEGEPARPTPCQALDHAAGYFLAAGINAALYKKAAIGGSWEVNVSLAGTMKYLRSLGQFPGKEGFAVKDITVSEQIPEYLETQMSGFGELKAVRHSAQVERAMPGWDIMPKPLGSDKAEWI
ncbi:Uncharacterized protein BP5553_07826 [Venustampulla echinocandica]|uniref:CoA-transferase family III n=1 Tax=Venustampulla echinocandica TaxID=2656787 RepID=A0A370THN9_9HELO|nr:Uncharacterized protein BP5553_07826 [Venustampulla echinocandica]RDL34698.1 Uncharacterized protein BP5553_07826 [Venustampulla echinocandica]